MGTRSTSSETSSTHTWLRRVWNRLSGAFEKRPGSSLSDTSFLVFPYILKEGEAYFLCYRIATEPIRPLVKVLYSKIQDGKGYYFFSLPVSHEEPGHLIKHNVAQDRFLPYAQKNAIYWLNEDGSTLRLETREA